MADPWAQFADADPFGHFADAPAKPATPKPAPTTPTIAPQGVMGNIAGFMSKVNRGMGIGDELAAGAGALKDVVTGNSGWNVAQTYQDELAHQRALEDGYQAAHPHMAALATGTGNAALMAVPAGPGAEAFAGGNLMTNAARGATVSGLTAAGYGAADRGTVKQRLMTAAKNSRDPVTLGLGAVGGALATPRAAPADPTPTLETLAPQRDAAYQAVRDSGVKYTPEAFQGLTQDIAGALDEQGFNAGLHPKTAAMMQRIGESDRGAGGMSPTLEQLDQLRQQIGRDVAASPDAGERRMGQIMRGKIDDFIANAGPDAITGGDPQQGAAMIAKARDLNTRVAKLESLDQLDQAAADRAAASGSGGNVNNATRQNVIRFKNDTGNLTPDERAAAQKVIDGTMTGNALRQVGKLSPAGNGLMTAGHIAMLLPTHGASAGVAVTGAVAKAASDAITARNVGALRDLIASGGQVAAEVTRQLADPAYANLRAQLANDLAVQGGVQGAARRSAPPESVGSH